MARMHSENEKVEKTNLPNVVVARDHPLLQVSGLSHNFGGYIGRRAFRYNDPVYPGTLPNRQAQLRNRLEHYFEHGQLAVASLPRALPRLPDGEGGLLDADRVMGILWGAAIGDALGNTTESMLPSERQRRYGWISEYLPNPHAGGRCVGLPSDDTQLSVWLLEALLEDGQPIPHRIAKRWRREEIYGIGNTISAYFGRLDTVRGWDSDPDAAWSARNMGAGNGALMRVPGAFLPHAWTLDVGVLDSVIFTSAMTHDDPTSTSACAAFAAILRRILWSGPATIRPGFFWETYVEVARSIEGSPCLYSRVPGVAYRGPLWRFVAEQVPEALRAKESVRTAAERWYSGAFLLETVPTVLHLLELHAADPREALEIAVNETWDNDTIASLVGALLGAIHGASAFPPSWHDGLLGRTTDRDDGRLNRTYRLLRRFGGFGVDD